MADFNPAVKAVLEHEGGYVNHPDDPGGETKFGISKRSHPDLDIEGLTRAQASEIYRREYWQPMTLGALTSQATAEKILDMSVNLQSGRSGRATRFIQRSLNDLYLGIEPLKVDGVFGPRTREAVNRADTWAKDNELRVRIGYRHLDWYARLVSSNMTRFGTFLEGWRRRAAFRVLHL